MQRRFIATITIALALCPWADAKTDEKPVGHAIFIQKSDGSLQPVYPVRVRVELEHADKIVQHAGSMSCEVRARVRDVDAKDKHLQVIQTVLRCDDGNTYVVTGIIYQGDAR